MKGLEHYKTIGNLFAYPDENYLSWVKKTEDLVLKNYPQTYVNYQRFVELMEEKDNHEIEELYGITFHIQAICHLDIGYVLFGEDFKRGEFLVNMKREQEKVHHDCGDELPDNLALVLNLIAISEDEDFVNELVIKMLLPALQIMLGEFSNKKLEARMKKIKNKEKVIIREELMFGNVYKNALQMLIDVIEADFSHVHYEVENTVEVMSTDFLTGCGSCSTAPNEV